MTVNWIINNHSKEESYIDLAKAVKELKYPLLEINGDYNKSILRDKFKNYISTAGVAVYDSCCTIFNGSIEMSKLVSKELYYGHKPIVYCNFEKFKCSNYYSYFGRYLFNDKYVLMSLSELKRQKFFIYGVFGKECLIFIRPDSGEKTFQAQLLDLLDFDRFFENHKHLAHELVLISTPKNIKWEGRIIVSKEKIIAHSTYRFQGQVCKIPAIPTGATDLVNKLLKVDYYPDSVFCYDLCQDSDDKFWLLELTSFSSAGLYACNKLDLVREVSKIAWDDYLKLNP